MLLRLTLIAVTTVWLSGCNKAAGYSEPDDTWNIRPNARHSLVPGQGSGGWTPTYSDDEDFMDSGSGSGSGMGGMDIPDERTRTTDIKNTTPSYVRTTDHPPTNCENMRQASQSLLGKYAPRCLPNGEFDSLQCRGYPGTAECWCSDLQGREVPGTLMEAPNYPSCDDGNNLPPCVHQLVKHMRVKLLGSFRPKCAFDGQFEVVQCRGSVCFCVDESTGRQVPGTQAHIPDKPKCGDGSVVNIVPDLSTKQMKSDQYTTEGNIDIDESGYIQSTPKVKDKVDKSGKTEDTKTDKETHLKSGQGANQEDKIEKASEIMTQPGILAGIIGGSVVLLLCLVLLAMFVIYRMRKKDEGSYPLDEPRKPPNYNYVRAPEKEFYA
uniref:Syndecan n=1 Tax=Arion vulgaris TaxID=1028688 RepID=A0A0B7A8U0_9EUPU